MLNDKSFEIAIPNVKGSEADELIILEISRYNYLIAEMGKLDMLRTYLCNSKKPTFAAIEAMLGIEGRTHD